MIEITERLRRVSHGLMLSWMGLGMFGCAGVILIIGIATHWRESLRLLYSRIHGPDTTLNATTQEFASMVIVVNAISLAAACLCVVGHQLCLATPEDVAGRGSLRTAFFLQIVNMLHLLWDLLGRFNLAPPVPPRVSWIVTALWLAAWGLLWLYLRPLARYIRRKDIKHDTRSFLHVYHRPEVFALGAMAAFACASVYYFGMLPWQGAAIAFVSIVLSAIFIRFGWLLRQVQLGTITYAELLVPRGGV